MENIFSHGNTQQILKYGYFKAISTVEIFCFLVMGFKSTKFILTPKRIAD